MPFGLHFKFIKLFDLAVKLNPLIPSIQIDTFCSKLHFYEIYT